MDIMNNKESDLALAKWAQTIINSLHPKSENREKLIVVRDRLRNGTASPTDYEWIANNFFI